MTVRAVCAPPCSAPGSAHRPAPHSPRRSDGRLGLFSTYAVTATTTRCALAAVAMLLAAAGAPAAAHAPRRPSLAAASRHDVPGASRSVARAGAAASDARLGEGPAGRTALTRWTYRLDAADRGLTRGWQRGGFAGAAVSVPHAIDAYSFKGRAGARNYEGSIAWYRTSFDAPQTGTYALR